MLPGQQSGGVGRALLERVFPKDGAAYRVIIATTDSRALARYLKAGMYARFPIYSFSCIPRPMPTSQGLEAAPQTGSLTDIKALAAIDREILGYSHPEVHIWWMQERVSFLYEVEGQRIDYGYSGYDSEPFALLDQAAVDYLLEQGYEMSAFTTLFMSDKPMGRCEDYILPSPPFSL